MKQSKQSSTQDFVAQALRDMHQALPNSTHAERQRFLAYSKGDTKAAIEKLQKYLEWREQHFNDDLNQQLEDPWIYAAQLAIQSAAAKGGNGKTNPDTALMNGKTNDTSLELPCPIFMHEDTQQSSSTNNSVTTKRYLQHLPARIDTKLAKTSVYAIALAIYVDYILDRNSIEKITLIIDVRSGHGWANIKAIHLVPFIQSTVRLLCDLHPMRLHRCIIFPVPQFTKGLWKAVKPFLEKETAMKVCLVSGPAGRDDSVPTKLNQYLDDELITKLEERRKSCFTAGSVTC